MPERIIVINTGPIIALIAATGDLSLLTKLYSRVIVPAKSATKCWLTAERCLEPLSSLPLTELRGVLNPSNSDLY